MNLDEQLAELLASLGVSMEEPDEHSEFANTAIDEEQASPVGVPYRQPSTGEAQAVVASANVDDEALAPAELSLFQTSREHYGVFYRLDLVAGAPQLRVFAPADDGVIKMRCYLVRAALGTPVREWFLSTRAHDGSSAYDEMRDMAEQHLLFAAGEALKRLFWAGELEHMHFPEEIEVLQLV